MPGHPPRGERVAVGPIAAPGPPRPRTIGWFHGAGLWAHYKRSMMAYFQFAAAMIGGPIVTSAMLLAVFVVTLGGEGEWRPGVSFAEFVAPGIAMVMIIHQAFEHAAALILEDKHEGTIADTLMAPLSAFEIMMGYVLAAVTTSLMIGVLVLALMFVMIGLPLTALWAVVGYAVIAAVLFALIGAMVGLWADKWEHFSAADSFLILPLGILSGAFFSLEDLPAAARWLIEANPVFYVIDGFRFGFIGSQDSALALGTGAILVLTGVFGILTWRLFAVGYKLKP